MMDWMDAWELEVTFSLLNCSFWKAVPEHPRMSLVASSVHLPSGHIFIKSLTFLVYSWRSSFDGSKVGTRTASWLGTSDGANVSAAAPSDIPGSNSNGAELRYQCEWAFTHTGNGLPTCKALKRVFQPSTAPKVRMPPMAKVLGYAKSATTASESSLALRFQRAATPTTYAKMAQHCYPTQPTARGLSWACKCFGTWKTVIPGSWLG